MSIAWSILKTMNI